MPPALLIDLAAIDLTHMVVDKSEILNMNPQRHEFEQLDGIVHYDIDKQIVVGLRDIKADEWWTRGHIPGRPLFPGVLMIEAAAQLAGFFGKRVLGMDRFVGFGGVDKVKFREAIVPPARLYILAHAIEIRPRRIICDVQGVVDGRLAFEGQITGVPM
jgi:3-hydroxyacyl-[acyl-carrier-protein] dehydratase